VPAPYSLDLRRRVVAAVLAGHATQAEIAERFAVSLTTVENWLRRFRATGALDPTDQRHGPRRLLSDDDDARIAAYLEADNDLTLDELAERFSDETGRAVSDTTIFRSLVRSHLTRKKKRSGPASA
jgi:transposase